jgi:hypothetical protein
VGGSQEPIFKHKPYVLSVPVAAVVLQVSEDALLPAGTVIGASHFKAGQYLDITGVTKGKGFAGVMKRWGFAGQNATHGNTKHHRYVRVCVFVSAGQLRVCVCIYAPEAEHKNRSTHVGCPLLMWVLNYCLCLHCCFQMMLGVHALSFAAALLPLLLLPPGLLSGDRRQDGPRQIVCLATA